MIENNSKVEDFHRSVSNHVLNFVPVKPKVAATLKWPLGFLTEDCKNSLNSDPQMFEQREIEVADHILGWVRELDKQLARG